MNRPRTCAHTSVVGGCFDPEFALESRRLFDAAKTGTILLFISPVLLEELDGAPPNVRGILVEQPATSMRRVGVTRNAEVLRDAYLAAGVLSRKWSDDALHVAIATTAMAHLIVSWNSRHLVNVARIRGFNSVNLASGYGVIDIRSPREVFGSEDQGV